MGIISWLLLGALAGWVSSVILKTNSQQGGIGNIIMGIVGALIGGLLGSILLKIDITGVNLPSSLLAIGGAIIFAFILNLITGKKSL
jgi:uncharacterized membrane protein YeaQ/YmgE (transglycosylase-associated protein family)